MNETILLMVAVFVAVIVVRQFDKKWHIGFVWRGFLMRRKTKKEGPFPYEELIADPMPTAVCVDFGAFRDPLQKLPGIKTAVLMLDRAANSWFLGFTQYGPNNLVPLNRHGPLKFYRTEADLRKLVVGLHEQGIKVLIGFWAFWGDLGHGPGLWIKKHPGLKPRQRGESDFGDLFVTLRPEEITLTEHICKQYEKLWYNFGFDGLFLGDGFCGFRNFFEPWQYRDQEKTVWQWTRFYHTIAEAVHRTGGELWAYDCMGFSCQEARLHGADYKLLSQAGLDKLVFQAYANYRSAWRPDYFRIPGKDGVWTDAKNFLLVKQTLSGTKTQVLVTIGTGDTVEGWKPPHKSVRQQMEVFRPVADGKLIVWGNKSLAAIGS